MFGGFGGGYQRFAKMKAEAESAPSRTVTRVEFVQACIADGMTPERAEFHAKINEGLGSEALIGGEKLSIRRNAGSFLDP